MEISLKLQRSIYKKAEKSQHRKIATYLCMYYVYVCMYIYLIEYIELTFCQNFVLINTFCISESKKFSFFVDLALIKNVEFKSWTNNCRHTGKRMENLLFGIL